MAGTLFFQVFASSQATIVQTSGGAIDDGFVQMDGSSVFQMFGGSSESVRLQGSSSGTFVGGSLSLGMSASEDAVAPITGGIIGQEFGSMLAARDRAVVTLRGGFVGAFLTADDDSAIRVVGSGFAVDGVPVGYGPLQATSGTLTGTLAGGQGLNLCPDGSGCRLDRDDRPGPGALDGAPALRGAAGALCQRQSA